jgi:hypothetical protein
MTKIWTQPKRELKRVPDMTAGTRGEIEIKEETAMLDGVPVVLFSAPGKVGVYVLAADLVSGDVTHEQAYDAVLNGNTVSSPSLTMQ